MKIEYVKTSGIHLYDKLVDPKYTKQDAKGQLNPLAFVNLQLQIRIDYNGNK